MIAAALADLRRRPDVASFRPAFPEWNAIALGGVRLATGNPMPDEVVDDRIRDIADALRPFAR